MVESKILGKQGEAKLGLADVSVGGWDESGKFLVLLNDSHLGAIWPPRRHMAKSEDMLTNLQQCIGQP